MNFISGFDRTPKEWQCIPIVALQHSPVDVCCSVFCVYKLARFFTVLKKLSNGLQCLGGKGTAPLVDALHNLPENKSKLKVRLGTILKKQTYQLRTMITLTS